MNFSKSIFLLCLISFFCSTAKASDFESGVKAAKAKNWRQAEQFFRNSIEQHPRMASAWYNLGTSLAAQQKESEAVWALEKSLKLDPKLKAARSNLQFCYTRLNIPDSWEPALPYFQDKAYQFGIDNWTSLSIALGFISAALIFLFIIASRKSTRKISLIFAVFAFLVMIFTLKNSLSAYHFRYSETHAVLIRDESSVYHDPVGNMKFDLNLKGGTRYEIEEITNGRIGLLMKNQMVIWIDQRAVRII